MIHPPVSAKGISPDEHVFTFQLAAALMIANARPEEPWPISIRRETLRSLVLGPSDWTTSAALLALTEVLLDEPEALDDVREWLDCLVAATPAVGHCPWATSLHHLVKQVPWFRPDLLDPLAPWLEQTENSQRGDC